MKKIKNLLIIALIIMITGCAFTPEQIGVSQEQWNNYSEARKNSLNIKYNQSQKIRKQLIDQQTDFNQKQTVEVTINNGHIMMPPFTEADNYKPVNFIIKSNECKNITFKQMTGANKVDIPICYLKQTVYMDPDFTDKAKALGSIRFVYMPLWNNGFTYYGVSSTGVARFNNVDVHIQAR